MPRALDVPREPAGWRDFRMLRMSKMTDYGIVLLTELARAGSGTVSYTHLTLPTNREV